jgi:hypothetical protein
MLELVFALQSVDVVVLKITLKIIRRVHILAGEHTRFGQMTRGSYILRSYVACICWELRHFCLRRCLSVKRVVKTQILCLNTPTHLSVIWPIVTCFPNCRPGTTSLRHMSDVEATRGDKSQDKDRGKNDAHCNMRSIGSMALDPDTLSPRRRGVDSMFIISP